MVKEGYKKEVYWPRVIEANPPEQKDLRAELQVKIKKFLLSIKLKEKREMLEAVYLNNFMHAKTFEQLELLFSILKAMNEIDRGYFVLREYKSMAYFDNALPIGYEQTISQPSTVARMLLLLFDKIWERKGKVKVYEIGTGSGWNVALIAYILKLYKIKNEIHSVDRVEGLVNFAKKNIQKLGNKNMKTIMIMFEDGFKYAKGKKFDYIIFTAGIPNTLVENKVREMARQSLKAGGRLLCPETYGEIFIFEKTEKGVKLKKTQEAFAFVPLLEEKVYE
ncbi:MAG: protein-L-isoaspartate O-methyltransferase [Candidatus Pacearchaeota archaeon]